MAIQTTAKPKISKHYYNLFLAVNAFNTNPDKLFVDFKSGDTVERIYRKQAVQELRFLLPRYRMYKDDKELIAKIVASSNTDVNIRQLIRESLNDAGLEDDQTAETKEAQEEKQKAEEKAKETQKDTSRLSREIIKPKAQTEHQPQDPSVPPSDLPVQESPPQDHQQEDESQESQVTQNLPEQTDRLARQLQQESSEQPQRRPQFRRPNIPEGLKRFGSSTASNARIAGNKLANGAIRSVGSLGRGILNAGGGLLRGGLGAGTRMAATGAARAGAVAAVTTIGWPVIVIIIVIIVIIVLVFLLLDSSALLNKYSPESVGKTDFSTSQQTSQAITRNPGICPSQEVIDQNKDTSCRYLNPHINLFDTNIPNEAIDVYITKYYTDFNGSKTEFIRRVNYIVDNAKQAGLNPVLFLGYWKSESQFSSLGTRDMGCVGDNFEEQVDCALGIKEFSDPAKNPVANCARSKDANSVACRTLKSIRTNSPYDSTHPVKYPIATLDDFAESYGPYDHLTNGKPTNCTHTYNTLIEVASRLNACTTTSTTVPIPTADLKQSIDKEFGITLSGFSNQQLQWAWEQFGKLSETNFINLARGTKITRIPGFVSEQTNCRNINFGDYQDKTLFQVTITHELGHIVYWCNPNEISRRTQQSIAFDTEGGITGYAQFAYECYQSSSITEDYAEMTAYYLNPGIPEQTRCHNRGRIPFANNSYPMHYNVAGSIFGRLNI